MVNSVMSFGRRSSVGAGGPKWGADNPVAAKVDFSCTNNVAEYEACILGLQAAIDFKLNELENQFADALATLASMASVSEGNIIEPLEIKVAKGSTHCNAIEVSEAKPWYEEIRNFLQTGQYPPVSTPFWTTGFLHENLRPKLGLLFITRGSAANMRAQRRELQEKKHGFPEGRFSGSDRPPVNLRGTFTENRDHSDPRTPQDIWGTLRKPRLQVPRSSRGNGLRSRTTSQRSPTRQKAHRDKHYNAQRSNRGTRTKIYMCSPLETTAGVILSPLGIQRNRPRTKRPPRSTGTAPTSRTASRVCQSTRPHRFVSVHSRGHNRLPKPLFRAFLNFSCIPGLGIIIPDSEKLGILRFLCVCGEIRRSMTDSHANLCLYVFFLHRIMHVFILYSVSMSGNSLNRSREDLVGWSKPKEPLGLTPREVAESPSWLPRATDGLLSPTQVVSRVFTFFASHESTPFY
ncbi:hypothetical protein CRG98_014087 [Punica granatum]|uniref:RNase H type-1 domain-containing protein n=1 Tax=Punica granatum TaxID=22663 RepID=A0A2I0KAM3_PUNGR|nr:hypothetical protein CRG98_014087 [Punica granatum]